MLTGQIGLIPHPHGWVEHAIETVTRAPVHHVVVAITETLVIGADPAGATVHRVSDYPDAVWSHFGLTDQQRHAIVVWASAHVGTPYSFLDDAAIGIALLSGIPTPRWVQERLSSDRHLQCAQLADAAYLAAGLHLFDDGRLPGAVYPGSFIPIWQQHGWWPGAPNYVRPTHHVPVHDPVDGTLLGHVEVHDDDGSPVLD